MKKQLLWLLLPLFAFTAMDWVTVKLDEKVSIDFPSAPEQKDMGGSPIWVSENDSNSKCTALVMDFGQFGLDSATLAAEMEKPESMETFRTSMMAQLPGAKLISEEKIMVKGYPAFEYVIDMGEGTPTNMYSRNIFIGAKMYSLGFHERKESDLKPDREKFFNSLKID